MRLRYLIYVILALALFSWVGSLAGLSVANLISTDGFRWLLLHGLQEGALRWLPHVVIGAIALGSISREDWTRRPRKTLTVCSLLTAVVAIALLFPGSLLRGVGGGLVPSPLSHSWWLLCCLALAFTNVVLSRRPALDVLTKGLCKSARFVVLFLIFAFLYNETVYIWKWNF